MIWGDRRPHLVALLVSNPEWAKSWAEVAGKPGDLEPVHKLVESDESVVIQGSIWRVEVPLVDSGESAAVSAGRLALPE